MERDVLNFLIKWAVSLVFISVQSPTSQLLSYVRASKFQASALLPNFLAIDYFGLFHRTIKICARNTFCHDLLVWQPRGQISVRVDGYGGF